MGRAMCSHAPAGNYHLPLVLHSALTHATQIAMYTLVIVHPGRPTLCSRPSPEANAIVTCATRRARNLCALLRYIGS